MIDNDWPSSPRRGTPIDTVVLFRALTQPMGAGRLAA